jgi:hypothetical protein
VLYLFASEAEQKARISVRDKATGAQIRLTLPAGHAALALFNRNGQMIAKYGFDHEVR